MKRGSDILEVIGVGMAEVVGNPGNLMDFVFDNFGGKTSFNVTDAPYREPMYAGMPLLAAVGSRAEVLGKPDSKLLALVSLEAEGISVDKFIQREEAKSGSALRASNPKLLM